MNLKIFSYQLHLKEKFVIARDAYSAKDIIIVQLNDGECTGYGEACEHVYYKVTAPQMRADLEDIQKLIESTPFENPFQFWEIIAPHLQHNPFALCALDQAAHDLYGKRIGKPTYEILNTSIAQKYYSNYTIGLGTIEEMLAKMEHYKFDCYKIKLGVENDLEIMEALRQHTNARFRIDANCAWTADETIRKSKEFKKLGVELIEQPLQAHQYEEMEEVMAKSTLPLIADESCHNLKDIKKCVGRFHGINIKLMKCGGISPAYQMVQAAQKANLQIMIGCMTEGSIGISAMAHLAPFANYIDADAALLLANNHSKGVEVGEDGALIFPENMNGLGAKLIQSIA